MSNQKNLLNEVKISFDQTTIENMKLTSSMAASKILREILPVSIEHREAFVALFLNRKNQTLGYFVVSIGGITSTIADGKLIFQSALKCNATGIVLCHNHPSGNCEPSQSDINLTRKLVDFGKFIDLEILDHIILTKDSYYSFSDEGNVIN